MSCLIRAPHPSHKVTMVLPNPKFGDTYAPQAEVIVKRSMLGRLITYVKSNPKTTLRLPFVLSRMKSLEVEAFFRVYYRAPLQIVLFYGTEQEETYVGHLASGVDRTAIGRRTATDEMISVDLEFSAEKQP